MQAARGLGLPLLALRTVADRLNPATGVAEDYLNAKACAARSAAGVVMQLARGGGGDRVAPSDGHPTVPAPKRQAVRRARVAVVGCGGWAQGWHLPHLAQRTDAEIVALIDTTGSPCSRYNDEMQTLTELGVRYAGTPAAGHRVDRSSMTR